MAGAFAVTTSEAVSALPQWSGSDRRSRLPDNWSVLRKRILRRDGYRCTHRDPVTRVRCAEFATDVDHIIAGDDHRESNLRSLCGPHHQAKSSSEGGAAMAAKRREIDKRFRRTEKHPGEA
jgi:5-methylcytosine-specific restriction protein A